MTVGPTFTVKQPAHVANWVSLFVTMASPAPVVALPETETVAVTWVELLRVVLETVMPLAEKLAVTPLEKFVPVMMTD